jgi:DNA polymerase-1
MHQGKTLVLVDGSSLAFRSFFALFTSGLRTREGRPTWAILGFFNSLFELIEKYEPEMLAVCFDLAGPTFRHEEFEDYKAHRAEMPDDLASQWPLIKEGVAALGLPVYELAGFEADDVIGSMARLAEKNKINVLILTGDQDAFQLVDGDQQQVKVLMPGKGGLQIFGRDEVHQKLGIWPEQVTDYKGLCGDTSDNIPGIKGIGPKTAVQLLTQFNSIDGIYANLEEVKSKSLKQKLIDGREDAKASKNLATIRLDVPIQFDFDHCLLTAPSLPDVENFFKALEFKSTVARLPRIFSHFRQTAPATRGPSKGSRGAELPKPPQSIGSKEQAPSQAMATSSVTSSATAYQGEPSGAEISGENQRQIQLTLGLTETRPADTTISTRPQASRDFTSAFEWQIVESLSDLGKLVERLSRRSLVSFSVQASGSSWMNAEIYGYALAWSDGLMMNGSAKLIVPAKDNSSPSSVHAAYIPIKGLDALNDVGERMRQVNERLAPIFAHEKIGKVVYNAKQTLNILSTIDLNLDCIVFDPMLASYIVFPDEKPGLKEQSDRLFAYAPVRMTGAVGGRGKQVSIENIPAREVAQYAADDTRLALELARYYCPILDSDQNFLLKEMELPLSIVLAQMEQAGVALDLPYLANFSRELDGDIQRLESEIYKHANRPFNINSTQQLGKILFEELGLPAKTKTKTGYSTDASVLEALRSAHPIIEHILEYRQLTKLRSTYVDALPKLIWPRDSRLHGEFNQTATSTGRLSSSNPNLQNIPIRTEMGRRMRRAFVPGNKKSVLLSADYSQIELRLLAHMSQDETLIDAFTKDQDVHARTAGEIFDIPIDEVSDEMRRIGKTLNFALIYQQGPFATSQQLGISTKEASAFIAKYFSRYASVRSFLDSTIEKAKQTGYVETLWKRRRYFKYLNDRNEVLRRAEERAACNAPLQGSAADLMKLAMIKLDQQIKERKLSAKLILQVHDELVLEVPELEVDEVRGVVVDAMLMGQPLKVPLKVDVGVAKNWMETK